LTLTLIKHYA